MVRQTVSEAKLKKLLDLNERLKEQLEIQRIPVSEASRSLIDYCQENNDIMIPSLWGSKHPDPFTDQVTGCGTCALM
ncbi:putative guanine nucleotide-binding protein gamma subunit [Hesseltinella vesiculosa]|uniref:Guanine nucleotide-binding protein subunit gamma n=1 Tax=Hesseltinella vesiculosa TaxID=101127 RepID=A0A1X2GS21_9FUNG|nr:putative guanine nucleotide-binding protein gamma subunit [Hesseltinella vesiculosa]